MRQVLTRLLRPRRRRAALAALRSRPRHSVLVLCHGNICRSPFAEAVLAAALGPRGVRVQSAGFIGPGRPSPAVAVAAAAALGVDLAAHRSQVLTAPVARDAGVIVVMNGSQRRAVCARYGRTPKDVLLLGDFDPENGGARAVLDPVDQPQDAFARCYARIARCAGAMAAAWP